MGQAASKTRLKTAVQSSSNTNINTSIFCEPRDLTALKNLEVWSQELCMMFDNSIAPHLVTDLNGIDDSPEIEGLFNNYPLILAYQGQLDKSQAALTQIIDFWSQRYSSNESLLGQKEHQQKMLQKMLQPTINLARLHRMRRDNSGFWQVLNQINCLNDNSHIELGGHRVTKTAIGDKHKFLVNVSFWETLKTQLMEGKFESLLALENSLPQPLIKTRGFREAQIMAFLNLGQYDQAKSIIRGSMFSTDGQEQNFFYYRLYELYQCTGQYDAAATTLADIIAETQFSKLNSLTERLFAAKLVEQQQLPADSPLAQKILQQYRATGDECNYGKLLLNLYVNDPSADVEAALLTLAKTTDYQFLQKAIGKTLNIDTHQPERHWSNKLDGLFNSVFAKG